MRSQRAARRAEFGLAVMGTTAILLMSIVAGAHGLSFGQSRPTRPRPHRGSITRADIAGFLLDQATDGRFHRAAPVIGN